jgi:Na+/melibiose symporter-like transporter
MPLSASLVVFTTPLVESLGPKRVLSLAWFLRNSMTLIVFLMPWAIVHWGAQSGWYVLIVATLGFSLMRAWGVGGWFPWMHELLEERERGTYLSLEMIVIQVVGVLISVLAATILGGEPRLGHFLGVYSIGILAGFASLVVMHRIPGGDASPISARAGGMWRGYRAALGDHEFRLYVVYAIACLGSVNLVTSISVLYLRDILDLRPNLILFLSATGSGLVALSIRAWGRYADHHGTGRALELAIAAHAVVAICFLLLLPESSFRGLGAGVLLAGNLVFGSVCITTAHRGMLLRVRDEGRVGYTNLWLIAIAVATGVTPILTGQVVQRLGLSGFRLCFAASAISGLVCVVWTARIPENGIVRATGLGSLVNPGLPFRTFARVMWITLGLDETNRREDDRTAGK